MEPPLPPDRERKRVTDGRSTVRYTALLSSNRRGAVDYEADVARLLTLQPNTFAGSVMRETGVCDVLAVTRHTDGVCIDLSCTRVYAVDTVRGLPRRFNREKRENYIPLVEYALTWAAHCSARRGAPRRGRPCRFPGSVCARRTKKRGAPPPRHACPAAPPAGLTAPPMVAPRLIGASPEKILLSAWQGVGGLSRGAHLVPPPRATGVAGSGSNAQRGSEARRRLTSARDCAALCVL